MTWRTHVLGGISGLWLLLLVPGGIGSGSGPNNLGLLASVAAVGALLPDLDAREAKIKRLSPGLGLEPFALPAHLLHRTLGHRGLLHSAFGLLFAAIVLGLPLALVAGWQPAAALLIGYASHLVLDACTRSGIPLWWPHPKRRYFLPLRLRFVTGGRAEENLIPLLAPLAIALLLRLLSAPFPGPPNLP